MDKIFDNAKWICSGRFSVLEPLDVYKENFDENEVLKGETYQGVHTIFKKTFSLSALKGAYKLRITADDYYKVYINGKFVGRGPAVGYYFNYYWNEYDVSDFLVEGENEIVADVYYHGYIARSFSGGDNRMGLICEINNSEENILKTDASWIYAYNKSYFDPKTIGYKTMINESYDSRIKPNNWRNAYEKKVDYIFSEEAAKPLQIYEKYPVVCEELEGGGVFYDFGTEITATLSIKAFGKSGDKIRILLGEELGDNPEKVRYKMRSFCDFEEFWILADGENQYEGYDYKAFRYAAIIPQENAEITDFKAIVQHYPFDDEYCNLETDNKILKSVWDICKNVVKFSSQEVFVDCPAREKGQYAGDLTITGASHLILTGDISLFKKALDNQMQSAEINKCVLTCTPGSLVQKIADYSFQFPILALRYYDYTGDKEYLKKTLKVCEGIIDYYKKYAREDGLLDGVSGEWNLVDWPENLRDNYDFPLTQPIGPGCHNVINAFYVGCVMQTEEIKDILGIEHNNEGEKLRRIFNQTFFKEELGLYTDTQESEHSSLHSNVIPAFYGINDKKYNRNISDFIIERGMCCGVYMAYFMLKALCKLDRIDAAYSFIISEDENSWYNMVREGATTCFEAWGKDKKFNTSLCHPWASGPIPVLVQDIIPNMPEVGKIVIKK